MVPPLNVPVLVPSVKPVNDVASIWTPFNIPMLLPVCPAEQQIIVIPVANGPMSSIVAMSVDDL
jgi:hypothetical protein